MALRSSTTAFAKSTRPEIGSVVAREALFSRLDGGPARTVAWISAPPGFGKTTLAASYLEARNYRWAWYQVDPDDDDVETFFHYLSHAVRRLRGESEALPAFGTQHRDDVAGFSRRFFRALLANAAVPMALVLDNLPELSGDSALRVILDAGLAQVPRQCCVIVTSRAPAPSTLSRLQPSGQMVCLAADDLRLTPAELAEVARLRGKPLGNEVLLQMHRDGGGWAAALVLMVEHHKLADAHARLPGETTPKAVFDYLAGEVFERFDAQTQRLLLQLAPLPRVTIDIARALSGDESAARVLFNLAHNDYFVRELVGPEGRVFVFHPLLREFLLHRAVRDLPAAVGAEALRKAARLLRDSGQPEDALALFVERRDWPEVAAIAAEQAETMLAQGRHATLVGWLELLPAAVLAANPGLVLGHAAALASVSPRAARRRYEEAFDAFRAAGDRSAMARCCVGVLDTVLREFDDLTALDRWLLEHDRCRPEGDGETSLPVTVLCARMWREPGHPSLARAAAARQPHEEGPNRALVRSMAAMLTGDFVGAAALVDEREAGAFDSPLGLTTCRALRSLLDGDSEAALTAARAGIDAGAAAAVRGHEAWLRLLAAAAAIGGGRFDTATAELAIVDALPLRRGDRAFLHHVRGSLALAQGHCAAALRETRTSALLAVEAGMPWFGCLVRVVLAQLLSSSGDRAGAESQLRSAEALAQRLGSPLLRLSTLMAQAAVMIAGDQPGAAVSPLQTGLALARDLGVHHVPGLTAEALGTLCATALRRGIAVEHTRTLIATGQLVAPAGARRLRRWPWAFEISTLGAVSLLRGGETIEFSAKGPGRPLELLKVLISLGGQNVRADQLADALWPHVDADYAHKSFTATLHRLRRIFGEDNALRLREGRLSLNESLFWLDGWALDDVLGEIEACFRDSDAAAFETTLRSLVEEALTLYRGPFLLDDSGQPAYAARREQMRSRLLRALAKAARHWQDGGRGDAAIDAYLRCIDADAQCEAFYRHLMLCYQRQGEPAEARATYERLHAVLSAGPKSVPSAETEAVYATLKP